MIHADYTGNTSCDSESMERIIDLFRDIRFVVGRVVTCGRDIDGGHSGVQVRRV